MICDHFNCLSFGEMGTVFMGTWKKNCPCYEMAIGEKLQKFTIPEDLLKI